jgi:hypothetical protein
MDKKSLVSSTEVITGVSLILAGVVAQAAGYHGMLSMALIPFGLGLALSEPGSRLLKDKLQRVKVRIRRDR